MNASFCVACVCIVLLGSASCGQTVVVPNANVKFIDLSEGGLLVDFGLKVYPFEFQDEPYSAWFSYSRHSVTLTALTADPQYYRLADFGDVFNPISHGNSLGETGTGDFYIGIWVPFENYGQTYGWVHLQPVDGKLTMVGNAMSYNSRGIIVGTTDVVPEPMSTVSAVIGLIALFLKRGDE